MVENELIPMSWMCTYISPVVASNFGSSGCMNPIWGLFEAYGLISHCKILAALLSLALLWIGGTRSGLCQWLLSLATVVTYPQWGLQLHHHLICLAVLTGHAKDFWSSSSSSVFVYWRAQQCALIVSLTLSLYTCRGLQSDPHWDIWETSCSFLHPTILVCLSCHCLSSSYYHPISPFCMFFP